MRQSLLPNARSAKVAQSHGAVQVMVFVNQQMVHDRNHLTQPVKPGDQVLAIKALTSGQIFNTRSASCT